MQINDKLPVGGTSSADYYHQIEHECLLVRLHDELFQFDLCTSNTTNNSEREIIQSYDLS